MAHGDGSLRIFEFELGRSLGERPYRHGAVVAIAADAYGAFADAGMAPTFAFLSWAAVFALAFSWIMALCARFRFEYMAINSPMTFVDCVESYSSDFESSKDAAIHFAITVDEPYKTLRERNDKIQKMVSGAQLWMLVAAVSWIALLLDVYW